MHYTGISLISESVDDIKFELPKYPKSNTDQSYYEPTGTTIANMRKSATSSLSEYYDFKDGKDNPNFIIPPTRKGGLDVSEVDVIKKETVERANVKLKKEVQRAQKEAEKKELSDVINSTVNAGSSVANDQSTGEK